jgi:hypothetical protein
MPLINATPCGDLVNCDPTVTPNVRTLRAEGPMRGFFVRFMRSLLLALHESRSEQALREIDRVRHLIPLDALKKGE